jgi:hypothetical protein
MSQFAVREVVSSESCTFHSYGVFNAEMRLCYKHPTPAEFRANQIV